MTQDTIYVDLSTLERVLKHGMDFVPSRVDGLITQVEISPDALATLAKNLGGIGGVVVPSDLLAASAAAK